VVGSPVDAHLIERMPISVQVPFDKGEPESDLNLHLQHVSHGLQFDLGTYGHAFNK